MDISTEFNTAIKTLHKEIYKRINSGVQTTSGKNLIRIGVLFDIEQFEFLASYPYWAISKDQRGHLRVTSNLKHRTIYMHRELIKPAANNVVDHINRNPLDNRLCNLRECSVQENNWNRGTRKGRTLPRGITRLPGGTYRVRVGYNGLYINVGTFGTLEEAINARILAVRERHGEFANVTL